MLGGGGSLAGSSRALYSESSGGGSGLPDGGSELGQTPRLSVGSPPPTIAEWPEEAAEEAGLLEVVFARSVQCPGGYLDRQAESTREGFEKSSAGSVWFTSKPFAAAASKGLFQVLQLILAIYFLYRGTMMVGQMRENGEFLVQRLRLMALELRDPTLPADAADLASLGLLYNGCEIDGAAESGGGGGGGGGFEMQNGTATLTVSTQAVANGYFFVTAGGTPRTDPVRWLVQASTDSDGTWSEVGGSAWRSGLAGVREVYPLLSFPTPLARNATVKVDQRITWPLVLAANVGGFQWAASLLLSVVIARLGRLEASKRLMVAALTVDIAFFGAAAAKLFSDGVERSATSLLLHLVPQVVFAVGLGFFEPQVVMVFFLYSAVSFACIVIDEMVLFHDRAGYSHLLRQMALSPAIVILGFSAVLIYFRRRTLAAARRLIRADQFRYDALWEDLLRTNCAAKGLAELQDLARRLGKDSKEIPRQYHRRPDGSVDLSQPVRSLDQLYVQATCLHPILMRKVQVWAAASRGCFPLAAGHEYMEYAVAAEEDPPPEMKFARVKAIPRAIEKLVRAYNQDASLLVDLCRQSIVFEQLSSVASCLRVIGEDPDVELLRVKNRLEPGYNSKSSAGYRDVGLNLRLLSTQARELGVEAHVCEVQLLLRPFAQLKSDEGHKRYVSFRNLRGE